MARVPFSCRVPEEDAVMAVKTEELHYPAANGTDTLSAQVWYEDGAKPKWILQIVHGMCEYMGRYRDFAEFMAQHGAVVCGNDHAGHGRSKGSDGYGDRWAKQVPADRPYLVLSGSMDPVGNYTKGVSEVCGRLKRAGVKDLTLKIYEGAHHEVLNETNHQEVYRDILDWTARALSSGEKPEAAKS